MNVHGGAILSRCLKTRQKRERPKRTVQEEEFRRMLEDHAMCKDEEEAIGRDEDDLSF